eukprot:4127599-Amphidinium_carterae.1
MARPTAASRSSRISATEQLVRNQFDILSNAPGGQLQPQTVPALIQHASQKQSDTAVTAIEAYQQLSA